MTRHYRIISILIFLILSLTACQSQIQQPYNEPISKQYRIVVPNEGIYQIQSEKLNHFGITSAEIGKLNLSHLGKSHPYWIDRDPSNDFSVNFYAPPLEKSSIINDLIFILEIDDEESSNRIFPNIIDAKNEQYGIISEALFSDHFEDQTIYLPDANGDDKWFWTLLDTNHPFDLELARLDQVTSPINISINLWSPTSSPLDPDHSVAISLNQNEMDQFYWKNAGEFLIEWQAVLQEPLFENTIRIEPNNINEDFPQKIYLDWIELQYTNPTYLDSSSLKFFTSELPLYVQINKTPGVLLSLTQDDIAENVFLLPPNTSVEIPNSLLSDYVWIPEPNIRLVSDIQPIDNHQMEFPQVDYLVFAPEHYHSTLQPLLDLRSRQGLQTYLLSPQQIYDWGNSGTPDPQAILQYIQQLTETNGIPPKYLLLVGDYSYQSKNYEMSTMEAPSFLVNTSLAGQTVSDFPYSDLDRDWDPDLFIGRIPASNPEQLDEWVKKVISYETENKKVLNQIVTISDPTSAMFSDTASDFIKTLKRKTKTNLIHFSGNEKPFSNNHASLSEDPSLLIYYGHGSIDRWGKTEILSSQQLLQPKTPSTPAFVISFSCLNGYFIHPEKVSLSEELLFNPYTKTIAMLSPTSLTLHENQVWLSEQLNSGLQLKRNLTFGEFITFAMRELNSENQQNRDILRTFILLGDPATRFPNLKD